MDTLSGRGLRSKVSRDGRLELSLADIEVGRLGPDEVVVRVEATPINPSDLGLLIGPADLSTISVDGPPERPVLSAVIPDWGLAGMKSRIDQSMAVGNEGAGTVVQAGANAGHLMGKTVGMLGGGMYATLRKLPMRDCTVLPDGASAADGASMFVNPLTALGFTETMRAEGHSAIVHTAAASNLGQMLGRICAKDGIPLINIVRSQDQVRLLRDQGAQHVLDSSSADFETGLTDAIAETGATLAFDAIGGGRQAAQLLSAMEAAAGRKMEDFSRYGSDTFKQVYIYGALDLSPTVLDRWVGFAWSVGGWLLTRFMAKLGAEGVARLKQRVADELTTTFASHYTATITLADVLDPDTLRACASRKTGEKYLIDPSA